LKTDEITDSNSPIKKIEPVKVQLQTEGDEKRQAFEIINQRINQT